MGSESDPPTPPGRHALACLFRLLSVGKNLECAPSLFCDLSPDEKSDRYDT